MRYAAIAGFAAGAALVVRTFLRQHSTASAYAHGFYEAVMLQERKEALLRQGYSEQEAEALLRIRLEAR